MDIVVIKYNAGNTRSVMNALHRIGAEAQLTDDPERIRRADKVIFPGVGEASTAMQYLRHHGLDRVIPGLQQPVLGVCLGMQLLCRHSEENDTEGLGVFDLAVRRFPPGSGKIPQIGWNDIYGFSGPLFRALEEHAYVYFVHGYYVERGAGTAATAAYGPEYSAALHRDNFYAVQFHPEKSAAAGERILRNFLRET